MSRDVDSQDCLGFAGVKRRFVAGSRALPYDILLVAWIQGACAAETQWGRQEFGMKESLVSNGSLTLKAGWESLLR